MGVRSPTIKSSTGENAIFTVLVHVLDPLLFAA